MYSGQNISVDLNHSGIAELTFDVSHSPVNIFNHQTVMELSEALTALENSTQAISGLLIQSGKDAFIAGADIMEFGPVFAQGREKVKELLDKSNRNFNRIENLPFPVVVALKGFALGGGCEIALACDYRLSAEKLNIGLPETRLGIIPGWGGTVRLPRIAGIETALEWIAAAKEYNAAQALKAGVIDGIVSDDVLQPSALRLLQQCIDGKLDYQARRLQKQQALQHNAVERTMAFTTSKAMVMAKAGKHYPAPIAAVNTIEKGATLSAPEALALETEAFIAMTQTTVAQALSGLFVSDQFIAKKAKQLAKSVEQPVTKAAVLGAGIMGGGIAYQSAYKGIPIKMKDIAQQGIDLGLSEVSTLLGKRVERGRLSITEMANVLNRIETTLTYDSFDSVDLVVEAVVENHAIKTSVLSEVEQQVNDDTIITSNTSTISINQLAQALQRPENFCGMHFFNPVHAMPLVEVIRGSKTSDAAVAKTVAYATAMGKKAIVVNDCPGFLVNRVLFPYFSGFAMLLRDGADYAHIDKLMESWGWPMGPAYLLDVIGIDTGVHAEGVMTKGFPSRMGRDYVSAAEALFNAGHLGQKTGQGFYRYEKDKRGKSIKHVPDDSLDIIAPHVAEKAVFSDDEIIYRLMIPMATELARCLEEGVVASVAEADMALIYGLGFPPFRGGIFRWLDSVGINHFCKMADGYQHLGELYEPTPGMREHTEAQTHYYQEVAK